jgi:hypothetical protein
MRITSRQAGWALVLGTGFGIGWLVGGRPATPLLQAAPPVPQQPAQQPEYSKQNVGYIHGNIPITREELGEYLIARYGVEKLELLINKRIIEHACKERGIEVTAWEVEQDFNSMIANLGVNRREFIEQLLQQYRKTEYEWKEDVIRPRLMLTQFCKNRIEIKEEDLKKAFESQYGEKVEVQIILYPPGPDQQRNLIRIYDEIRKSDEAFQQAARQQPDANLSRTAGKIKPISRYSGLEDIEKVAFSLRPGEVSEVVQVKEGFLIMKCLGRVPADTSAKFELKRDALRQQVMERKIQEEIPKVFQELSEKATPQNFLRPDKTRGPQQVREIHEQIQPMPQR